MTYVMPIFIYEDSAVSGPTRIQDYVTHHPKSRRAEIAEALGIDPGSVSSTLDKLAKNQRVCRLRDPKHGGKWVWEALPRERWIQPKTYSHDKMSQETVTAWKPERRRDPLTAALFGNGNVDRRTK